MPTNQIGWQALTVSTTAVSLTQPTGGAKHAIIRVVGGPVRWRADGTAPTSTVGMLASANQYIEWMELENSYKGILYNIQFIRDASAGADATLEIAYFD